MLDKLFNIFSTPHKPLNGDTGSLPHRFPPKVALPIVAAHHEISGPARLARHEGLISKLLDDHRSLLALYGQVKRNADAGNWFAVQQALGDFQTAFTDHILVETVRLYSYLKRQYKDDNDAYTSIQDFAAEMSSIQKNLTVAFAQFSDIAVNPERQLLFPQAWQGVGMALANRIAREEKTLYPLY